MIREWANKVSGRSKEINSERWALSLSHGQAFGVLGQRDACSGKIHLLRSFNTPCPLNDPKVAGRLLSKAGVSRGSSVILLATPDEFVLSLMEDPLVSEAETSEVLRWKMAESVDFDLKSAIIDIQKTPGPEEGGLQKPRWWVGAMSEERLKERLLALDALGAVCGAVDCSAFAQSALASLGWQDSRARGLVCVGEGFAALSFTANGSLLFEKRLEWELDDSECAENWDRLALALGRSLDYFERRLSSVAVGELLFAGAQAALCAEKIGERLALPARVFSWDAFFVDEAGCLSSGDSGRNAWLAGALTVDAEMPL